MESEDEVMEVRPKVKAEFGSSPPPKSNVVANLAQPRTPKVTRVQSPRASPLARSETPKSNRSSTPNKSTPSLQQHVIPSPSTPLSLPSTSVTPSKSSSAAGSSSQSQGVFAKEIRHMMYGLGDHKTPYKDSVDLVEQLVLRFVAQLVTKAQEVGNRSGGKVAIEDIVFVLRKDRAKFARVRELLTVNDELKKAKKAIADFDSIPAT